MIANVIVPLLLISVIMSSITTSLIITNYFAVKDNSEGTKQSISNKLDMINSQNHLAIEKLGNETSQNALILAELTNLTAFGNHHILEQINSTINHTK